MSQDNKKEFASVEEQENSSSKQFEAQALLQLARTAEANEVIVAALTSGARMSERWAEPELHRIQAIILGAGTAGNAALQRALECARSQEAAFSELRTALDLAKRSRGSTDGELTSEQLSAALRKFGSDLDHPLLDKAKTLLATLDA